MRGVVLSGQLSQRTIAPLPRPPGFAARSMHQLAGKVENIVYFGTDTHFHIDLDSGGDLTVRVQNRRGYQDVLKNGDAVGLRIAPEAMQVLKD